MKNGRVIASLDAQGPGCVNVTMRFRVNYVAVVVRRRRRLPCRTAPSPRIYGIWVAVAHSGCIARLQQHVCRLQRWTARAAVRAHELN